MSSTVTSSIVEDTLRRLSRDRIDERSAWRLALLQWNDTRSGRGDTRKGAGDCVSDPCKKRRSSPFPLYIRRIASALDWDSASLRSLSLSFLRSTRIWSVVSRRSFSHSLVKSQWASE